MTCSSRFAVAIGVFAWVAVMAPPVAQAQQPATQPPRTPAPGAQAPQPAQQTQPQPSRQPPGSAPLPAGAPTFALPQGFSIVLVTGDTGGDGSTADTVPAAAKRALADMRDFLPYRSYRLLDTSWILGSASGKGITTRLGAGGREYEVAISTSALLAPPPGTAPGRVNVRFRLTSARVADSDGTASVPAALADAQRRYVEASDRLGVLEAKLAPNHPDLMRMRKNVDTLQATLAALEAKQSEAGVARSGNTTTLIDTSFTMDVGETVVVGTSRLQGSTALLALLTAVPLK